MSPEPRRARRVTQRPRSPRPIDTSVPSPCLAICEIPEGSNECLGCRRTVDEIRNWIVMTAAEKQAVLDRLATLPDRVA